MIKYGFFNSENGDRKYNADDMNMPFKNIVSDGVFADGNGILSTQLQVQSVNNLKVKVKKGFGIFGGKWFESDSDIEYTLNRADVALPRIDSFFIEVNNLQRQITIKYVQGVASSIPKRIERIFNSDIKQYRLCDIYVNANAVAISQADITDCRPLEECGIITNLLANSDLTATYLQWEKKFYDWFTNLKDTVASLTAISSYTSRYVTTRQDETLIPINISQYYSVVDILQVYINGLILVENVDYTIVNYTSIKLKNGVDIGTEISFIVYKSIDGSSANSALDLLNILENKVESLEQNNKNPLWTGALTMDGNHVVNPSKALSNCKNGWLLCWCDYNYDTNTSTDSQFVFSYIPKNLIQDLSISIDNISVLFNIPTALNANGNYTETVKNLIVRNNSITGYSGNAVTTDGKDVCLRAIYEF